MIQISDGSSAKSIPFLSYHHLTSFPLHTSNALPRIVLVSRIADEQDIRNVN